MAGDDHAAAVCQRRRRRVALAAASGRSEPARRDGSPGQGIRRLAGHPRAAAFRRLAARHRQRRRGRSVSPGKPLGNPDAEPVPGVDPGSGWREDRRGFGGSVAGTDGPVHVGRRGGKTRVLAGKSGGNSAKSAQARRHHPPGAFAGPLYQRRAQGIPQRGGERPGVDPARIPGSRAVHRAGAGIGKRTCAHVAAGPGRAVQGAPCRSREQAGDPGQAGRSNGGRTHRRIFLERHRQNAGRRFRAERPPLGRQGADR